MTLEAAWKAVAAGIEAGAFPGAVAAIADRREIIAWRAFGHAALEPAVVPMKRDFIFDVASLTKVVATTPAVLLLAEAGELSLDEPVSRFIPAWRGPVKETVTIRQLLTHTSGLAAWYPTYAAARSPGDAAAVVDVIAGLNLAYTPGTKVEYSCLGYILLGRIVEHVAAQPLDRFCTDHVFQPLGMRDTSYRPSDVSRVVATERGNLYEREMVRAHGLDFDGWDDGVARGQANDGNARYGMGGVSGNAGLFTTAADLVRYGQEWLKALQGGSSWLSQATATLAVTNHTPVLDMARGLGWVLMPDDAAVRAAGPAPVGPRWCGELLSPGSFGHTGFTGTSIWIDPHRGYVFVLLTNRVHPHVRTGIEVVRARFHNAAVAALTGAGR